MTHLHFSYSVSILHCAGERREESVAVGTCDPSAQSRLIYNVTGSCGMQQHDVVKKPLYQSFNPQCWSYCPFISCCLVFRSPSLISLGFLYLTCHCTKLVWGGVELICRYCISKPVQVCQLFVPITKTPEAKQTSDFVVVTNSELKVKKLSSSCAVNSYLLMSHFCSSSTCSCVQIECAWKSVMVWKHKFQLYSNHCLSLDQ